MRQRNARQWAGLAIGEKPVRGIGGGQRLFPGDGNKRIEPFVVALNPGETGLG